MQVKLDEDLPHRLAEILRRRGFDAATVLDQRMGGFKDPDLWREVQAEGRFLITADKGFADVRRYPPGTHQGVLLLRPDKDGIDPLVELLEQVLAVVDLAGLRGKVAVAASTGLRIRHD